VSDERDRNYISVGQWMLWLLLAAIPCVGIIVIIIMAFIGENESRKNYFRALIAWFFIILALFFVVAVLGGGMAAIQEQIQRGLKKE
jgi:high-affinity Fe2+/Pb2+ permease